MTLLLAALLLVAQDTTVSSTRGDLILQGAVTDVTSLLMPGVVVSLRHQDGMLWMSTNEGGKYSFQGLKPGRYQIQADLLGFQRSSQEIELNVSTTVDIVLNVPATSSGSGVSISRPVSELSDLARRPTYTSWVSDLPPWFAFGVLYKSSGNGPPVGWLPKQPTDIARYNVEGVTSASVAYVADFYREVMKLDGLVIENESPQTETSYSLRARTKDGAHEVNLNVRRPAGTVLVQLTDSYTLPKN